MSINLRKGQKIDLTKGNTNLKNISVGLGWDVKSTGRGNFDLDAMAFLLNKDGKLENKKDKVYFGNLKDKAKSVIHSGDNLTGAGAGDDEVINVDFSKIPSHVEKIVFAVDIYQAQSRGQSFGQVSSSFIRIFDNNGELVRFDLGNEFQKETGVVAGEIYRHNGEWKFNAVGAGYADGLKELTNTYKI